MTEEKILEDLERALQSDTLANWHGARAIANLKPASISTWSSTASARLAER